MSIFPWGEGYGEVEIHHLDWESNRCLMFFWTREQDEPLHAYRERYPLGAYDGTTRILRRTCGYGGSSICGTDLWSLTPTGIARLRT